MTELSDHQVRIILERIKSEGISRTDLQHDVLDHISCLVEEQMDNGASFDEAFNAVVHTFSPFGSLREIEHEITLISTKKIILMKKVLIVASSVVMMLFFITTFLQGMRLLNNYQWSFMEEIAFANQYLICLLFLPVYWYNQYRLAAETEDGFSKSLKQIAFMVTFLCSEALVNAVFFKLMSMPGGNQLFIIAGILGAMYIPFYGARKLKLAF